MNVKAPKKCAQGLEKGVGNCRHGFPCPRYTDGTDEKKEQIEKVKNTRLRVEKHDGSGDHHSLDNRTKNKKSYIRYTRGVTVPCPFG